MRCSGLIDILIQAQVMILWGFLDALTRILSIVRVWVGGVMEGLIWGVKVFGIWVYRCENGVPKSEKYWLNGVAMARHGLILWENEATGSRKVFRCLLDLRDVIF